MELIKKTISKKVSESRISEKTYRNIKNALSYSALKLYDTDKQSFFKQFILNEKKEEKKSDALVLGDLIHTLISGSNFDDKFVTPGIEKPSGQLGDLCENMYKVYLQGLNPCNEQLNTFATIFTEGFQKTKFNWKGEVVAYKGSEEEKVLPVFMEKGAPYYEELILSTGKTLVFPNQYSQAENIVNRLKEHPYTMDYINCKDISDMIEVFDELPFEFEIMEILFKCLFDRVIINHHLKEVQVLDWKTSFDADEDNAHYSFLKYGYYIQAGVYMYGIQEFIKKLSEEHNLEGYAILQPKFVFIDSKNFAAPVILEPSMGDIQIFWENFKVDGRKYSGIANIINDIQWSISNNVWDQSRELFENKGHIQLQLNYSA